MNTLYAYKNCDTCRRAAKFLRENHIPHLEVPIRDTPPTAAVLRSVLASAGGDLRRLFNTSGLDYRQLDLKRVLPTLTPEEALALLSKNGNLIKRPLLTGPRTTLIGFRPDEWQAALDTGLL